MLVPVKRAFSFKTIVKRNGFLMELHIVIKTVPITTLALSPNSFKNVKIFFTRRSFLS